jgi:PAS domain S-box-containing protein
MATGVSSYATRLLTAPALRSDGVRLSVEFSMVVVRDEGGEICGVGAIIRDVTERWQREKALRERLAAVEKS